MHRLNTPLSFMLFAIVLSGSVKADVRIASVENLPPSVRSLYYATCPEDGWMENHRKIGGSTSKTLSDGTEIFLMVCGDAATTVPFTALAARPSRSASEVRIAWILKGRDLRGSLQNARFGPQRDTVVSTSHSSATCNPGYTHRWDGIGFELIAASGYACADQ